VLGIVSEVADTPYAANSEVSVVVRAVVLSPQDNQKLYLLQAFEELPHWALRWFRLPHIGIQVSGLHKGDGVESIWRNSAHPQFWNLYAHCRMPLKESGVELSPKLTRRIIFFTYVVGRECQTGTAHRGTSTVHSYPVTAARTKSVEACGCTEAENRKLSDSW